MKSLKAAVKKNECPWVCVTVCTGDAPEEWYGQLTTTMDDFVKIADSDFIRLNHVVWVEGLPDSEEIELVANEDNPDIPFESYIYVRKREIVMVRPLRFPLNPPAVTD